MRQDVCQGDILNKKTKSGGYYIHLLLSCSKFYTEMELYFVFCAMACFKINDNKKKG